APFGAPALRVEGGGGSVLDQELGHVEADAAGADDRYPPAGGGAAVEDVQVADHPRVVGAGEVHLARHDAGGQHDLVEAGQRGRVGDRAQAQLDTGLGNALLEVAQGLGELFLAGDPRGDVELAADPVGGLEQGDVVAAPGRDGGA